MAEHIFASKAVAGERYLTHKGMPIVVLGFVKGETQVRSELTGSVMLIPGSKLFQPYNRNNIPKEALAMARATKQEEKASVRKSSMTLVEGKRKIERVYKGKEYVVNISAEGFKLGDEVYPSLTAVARKITGYSAISGPAFFGVAA